MYRTMEMRVEPKLSYPERLIISGSKRKIWFGYFLFAMKSVLTWVREELRFTILKVLCFVSLFILLCSVILGLFYLLTLVPAKLIIMFWLSFLGGLLLFCFYTLGRAAIKNTLATINEKTANLKEVTLQKLGPATPICCDILVPDYRSMRNEVEELSLLVEEQNNQLLNKLRKLENVRV